MPCIAIIPAMYIAILLVWHDLSYTGNGGPSLPRGDQSDSDNGFIGCPPPLDPTDCFLAGDVRANEQVAFPVQHTIFLREHNRIARELQGLSPQMSDDEVFKMTREIVAAEMQKITYMDYWPIILGQRYFDKVLKSFEAAGGYDPRFDTTIPNVFSAAAFRFGHSQIQPVMDRLDENFQNISAGPLNLVDAFFNPSQFAASEGTDPLLRGLVSTPVRTVDEFLNSIITTRLFESETSRMDLATLNIQRARDHGIQPYIVWKKWATRICGETSEFQNELTYIRFLQTYGSLDTVDLWVGGLAEEPVSGGLVGATFACIFANTFQPLRNGDRFYFENVQSDSNPDAFFTAEQRDEIKKASLSRIICDNSDNIQEIQPNAFRLDQLRIPCDEIPSMDLSVFVTEMCAMRVQITTVVIDSIRFRAQSTPLPGTKTTTTNVQVERGESTACVPFLCPEPGRQVELRISTPNDLLCNELGRRRNPRLPSNLASFPLFVYRANIGTNNIRTNSGAYESVSACESGTEDGLFYSCPFAKVQSDDKHALTQKKVTNEDKNEKLITLLEEYVQELKEEEKPKQTVKDDQARLLSELEGALNSY